MISEDLTLTAIVLDPMIPFLLILMFGRGVEASDLQPMHLAVQCCRNSKTEACAHGPTTSPQVQVAGQIQFNPTI